MAFRGRSWLEMFEDSVPEARRWGSLEDEAMLFSMPDFIAGPETRRQLVAWLPEPSSA